MKDFGQIVFYLSYTELPELNRGKTVFLSNTGFCCHMFTSVHQCESGFSPRRHSLMHLLIDKARLILKFTLLIDLFFPLWYSINRSTPKLHWGLSFQKRVPVLARQSNA